MSYSIYTDGSCKPTNPGYCGLGVVFVKDDQVASTFYKFLGKGTNNVAELEAIYFALRWLKDKDEEWGSHKIFTDSNYAVGLLTKNWNASKNKELVKRLRTLLEEFPNTSISWIKGHDKNQYNEMADQLANQAVEEYLDKKDDNG